MKKAITIIMFLSAFTMYCQDETKAVKSTIQNYYDGYIDRDIKKLNKAFDLENGTMKVPILKDEKVIGFNNLYFKDLVLKWGNRKKLSPEILQNCGLKILSIDIVDDKIASAKISMKVDTITYIDILSIQKIKGKWKITNKIYSVRK